MGAKPATPRQTFEKDTLALKEDGTVRFFGATGRDLGIAWDVFPVSGKAFECAKTQVGLEIQSALEKEFKDDEDDRVSHILVHPETAVLLFLEGYISTDHMLRSEQETGQTLLGMVPFNVNGEVEHIYVAVHPYSSQPYAIIGYDGMKL
ncbi:hypothetical protein HOI83_04680 [Candidatus Uhrbacteria bacterium]|jgi:hypothetical protein|nr:hypothetical protein [Candidatus Uhrbacteria bacterium]